MARSVRRIVARRRAGIVGIAGIAISLGAAMALAACGSSGGSASSGASSGGSDVFAFGVNVPLSGADGIYGQEAQQVVGLAIANIEKAHMIKGTIKPYYYDTQDTPQVAVTGYNQLVSVRHVLGVETLLSANVKAQAPIATQNKVPVFNVGGSSPDLVGLSPYLFNLLPLGNEQLKVSMPWAAQQGLKKWAVMYSTDSLGLALNQSISQDASKYGITVAGSTSVDPTASDFQSQIAQLKQFGADEIYIATSEGGAVPTFVTQARAAGYTGAFLSYNGTTTPDLLKDKDGNGLVYTSVDIDLTQKDPVMQAYATAYQAKYHQPPLDYQATDYNAVLVFARAIQELQSENMPVTGVNIAAAVHKVGTFALVGGTTDILGDNTVAPPISLNQVVANGSSAGSVKVLMTLAPDQYNK
jgi:branched-chain amino acid transport system substrate-binding protein